MIYLLEIQICVFIFGASAQQYFLFFGIGLFKMSFNI